MAIKTRRADNLARKRCFNHASREAAGRCPTCRRFFCRECVTEHAGRIICASCLGEVDRHDAAAHGLRRLAGWLACGVGLLVAWAMFYYLGKMLLMIPTAFHEGAMWDR